ncbi:hypothetical protein ACGFZH_40120 [Streptomyces zaomyceticus]|uniref:hypothetical protein n=1 Tax=Streptomyces zaomyceticus TaxID=68286 RepID=UPI003711DD65
MGRGTRWLLAGGVTIVAFAVPTVVCGTWVFVPLVADVGARWGAASASGAAVAALAVLWGQGFARSEGTAGDATARPPRVEASGERAVAVAGPVKGNISTGDSASPRAAPPPTAPRPAPGPRPADESAPPGSVMASGERSVAVGGEVEGHITTGDRPEEGPRA